MNEQYQERDDVARRGFVGRPNGRTERSRALKAMSPAERRANRLEYKAKNRTDHAKAVLKTYSGRKAKKAGGAKARGKKCR